MIWITSMWVLRWGSKHVLYYFGVIVATEDLESWAYNRSVSLLSLVLLETYILVVPVARDLWCVCLSSCITIHQSEKHGKIQAWPALP